MQHNQHIADLGALLVRMGIKHVVICPGSRNAPLIQCFTGNPSFHCHSIVDERSAGYVALGMARQLQQPVVLLTTSGTAVLNLAPAVAEAWYQQIPLLVITADRPMELIPQFNNQIVDQQAPFFSHTKGFYELPSKFPDIQSLILSLTHIQSLIQATQTNPLGPVHMNVLLDGPLYDALPQPVMTDEDYQVLQGSDGPGDVAKIETEPGRKILILVGMGTPGKEVRALLTTLSGSGQAVVIAENIANTRSDAFISNPELVLAGAEENELKDLRPDLLVTFGGQVVSKRLRLFLQSTEQLEVITLERNIPETLKGLIPASGVTEPETDNQFFQSWDRVRKRVVPDARDRLGKLSFSNLAAVNRVMEALPDGCVLHLGNSGTIRYSQLVPVEKDGFCFANRGTSGIDGCVSTTVGAAMVSSEMHVLLVGDLSFVYDSNALWNKDFPTNLRIIVLNDGGGGIFRLLEGPDRMEFFEEFSVTHHPVSIEMLSHSFGRRFQRVTNMDGLDHILRDLFKADNGTSVLEVDTSGSENSRIFKDFINLKS